MRMTSIAVASGALAAIALVGCRTYTTPATPTVVQVAPAPAPAAAPPVVVAAMAPPPLQAETAPPAPYPDAVWIPGYWNWSNGQYSWVPGRYEAGRVGYRWVPQRWENINGQWQMTGGSWVRQ